MITKYYKGDNNGIFKVIYPHSISDTDYKVWFYGFATKKWYDSYTYIFKAYVDSGYIDEVLESDLFLEFV